MKMPPFGSASATTGTLEIHVPWTGSAIVIAEEIPPGGTAAPTGSPTSTSTSWPAWTKVQLPLREPCYGIKAALLFAVLTRHHLAT